MKNPTKKINCNIKYQFSNEELIALGKELGESQIKLRQLDDDRKMVVDEWKSKISNMESHIGCLSNKTCSGYEFRDIACSVTYNDPTAGNKTVRRLDTGESLRVMQMDDSEKQEDLPLDGDSD